MTDTPAPKLYKFRRVLSVDLPGRVEVNFARSGVPADFDIHIHAVAFMKMDDAMRAGRQPFTSVPQDLCIELRDGTRFVVNQWSLEFFMKAQLALYQVVCSRLDFNFDERAYYATWALQKWFREIPNTRR